MRSYKNWKVVNESYLASGINLGLVQPQVLGLHSDLPLSEKKKVPGKVVVDKEEDDPCSCKGKKKMKKHMDGEVDLMKKKKVVGDDDDVNDVDVPGDEEVDDDDDGVEVDDDDVVDDDGEGDEEGDDDEGEEDVDDEGDDAPKFGFMKDKKKKCGMSKMKKEEVEQMDESEKEFWASLKRQCGQGGGKRYSGGVKGDGLNEDLLLTPDQLALFNAMPGAGEVGFAPVQRVGDVEQSEMPELDSFSYGESVVESDNNDLEVLCKYFSESDARKIIEKSKG